MPHTRAALAGEGMVNGAIPIEWKSGTATEIKSGIGVIVPHATQLTEALALADGSATPLPTAHTRHTETFSERGAGRHTHTILDRRGE